MAQSAEREIIYRLRVEGAEGLAATFNKAAKAATDANAAREKSSKRVADQELKWAAEAAKQHAKYATDTLKIWERMHREKEKSANAASAKTKKEAEADARFEQRVATDTYQLRMKLWRDQQKAKERAEAEARKEAEKTAREDAKIANDTYKLKMKLWRDQQREEERAAREAEQNAKKAEHLQEQATKKYLAGAQQGVSALSSLVRSGVLLWAANEEEAEKALKTLATFEAGAQFLQGTIDALQTMVTMWEAAETAAKAYALAEAAAGATSAVSGAGRVATGVAAGAAGGTASAVAGGAAGAAATGGVWATLSGAFSSAVSTVAAGISALATPLVGIGAAFAAAAATTMSVGGDIISYFTGLKNYWSLSGAISGAGSLLGFGSNAAATDTAQKKSDALRSHYTQRTTQLALESEQASAMREAERSFGFRGSSLKSRQSAYQSDFSIAGNRLDTINSQLAGVAGKDAAQETNLNIEAKAAAQDYHDVLARGLEIQKELASKEVNRMQETIRMAEAATDAARRARKEAEQATMSAAERFAAMSGGERARAERAAGNVLAGKGISSRSELQALSPFADVPDIKREIEAYAIKTLGSGGAALQALYDRNTERAQEAVERAQANERLVGDSARANKNIEVKADMSGKLTLTLDDSVIVAQFAKLAQEKVIPTIKASITDGFNERTRNTGITRAGQ